MKALVYHGPGERAWDLATHRYALGDTMTAYDTFADAGHTGALKVVLQGSSVPHVEPAMEAVLVAG